MASRDQQAPSRFTNRRLIAVCLVVVIGAVAAALATTQSTSSAGAANDASEQATATTTTTTNPWPGVHWLVATQTESCDATCGSHPCDMDALADTAGSTSKTEVRLGYP